MNKNGAKATAKKPTMPGRGLPSVEFNHADDASAVDSLGAIAALDAATVAAEPAAPGAPEPPAQGATVAAPSPVVSSSQNSPVKGEPQGSPNANGSAAVSAPPAAAKPKATTTAPADTAKPEKLTSKKYNGVKADVLRALVIERDNELVELRNKVATTAPVAAAANLSGLSLGIGEGVGFVSSLIAFKVGDEARLSAIQKTRLGDVWAPILAPYLNGTNAALIQALMTTADVVTDKVVSVRAARAAVAERPSDSTSAAPSSSRPATPGQPVQPSPSGETESGAGSSVRAAPRGALSGLPAGKPKSVAK